MLGAHHATKHVQEEQTIRRRAPEAMLRQTKMRPFMWAHCTATCASCYHLCIYLIFQKPEEAPWTRPWETWMEACMRSSRNCIVCMQCGPFGANTSCSKVCGIYEQNVGKVSATLLCGPVYYLLCRPYKQWRYASYYQTRAHCFKSKSPKKERGFSAYLLMYLHRNRWKLVSWH